ALRQLGADGGGSWLLVGTGGAARAVAVAAATAKADLHVVSRDAARARGFTDWARGSGARAEPARGALQPDVAINATPLGLKEADPLPLDPERARRLAAALDLVYAPGGTRRVRALRPAGAAVRPLPRVRRLAGSAGARPFGRVARRGSARRRTRAQVRGPAAHCRRPCLRHGVARSPGARSRLARAGAARAGAAARARLQPERAPGARPEPALEPSRGRAPRPDARHRHPNGVDTRGAAGERGRGRWNGERR